ncbi:hypothetical protein XB05_08665 [Xanthomonas arboricola]|uniref:hypothetical protein n=1 Tax=Xanthomonas arboricola TaxID=56448 RepID=UPI00061A33A5|nr:hypothetical protein [Xanthomonas arboricola]AKC78789.1 hypothetical protein XB05_08665 [Xanthomonas arboricola]
MTSPPDPSDNAGRADLGVRTHIRRETLVNVAANLVIAPLLDVAIHGREHTRPTWGTDGLVVELVTQAASVAVFGSAIPSYVTWRKVQAGSLAPLGRMRTEPAAILGRALLLGLATATLVGAVGAGALLLTGLTEVGLAAVLAIKAALGGAIAAVITPPALRRTLGARDRD